MMKNKKMTVLIILIILIIVAIFIKNKNNKFFYETTKIESFEYFILSQNDKYGIINKNGEIVIKPSYTDIIIPNPEKDIFFCYNNEEVDVLNIKGEKIFAGFEFVEPVKLKNVATTLNYEKSIFKFKKDGKFGLINSQGKIIVKNEYEDIENLQLCEGIFLIKKDNKYGIINGNGAFIIKPKYDNILSDGYYTKENGYTKSGYIVVNKTNEGYRYGYITNKGKVLLEDNYNSISRITLNSNNEDIYLIVSQKGQYGIFKNKKSIINMEYQSIDFDEESELFIVEKNKKYGVFSLEGKNIIEVENTKIERKGIYLYVNQVLENKVYDYEGNIINISFNKAIYNSENENYRISTLENNGSIFYGIVDKNGNTLVSEKYEYIEYAFGTYFIAKNEVGKYGIISSNGKEILEFRYNILQKLKDKNILQAVDEETGETYLYSSNLKVLLSEKKVNVDNEEGYVKVQKDKDIIFLDAQGNKIDEFNEENLNRLQEPQKIGKYKKVQFTLEKVYYVEDK